MDLKSPLVVSLEITSSCNLNCLYCYADPICGGHMHKLVFFDLIDSLLKQGVFKIHLSGGEPFLHPDIFEILKFSDDRQIDPALSTNGVVLNKQMIEKYSQVFTNAALRRIQISLDSHIEKIHNLTRGFFKEIMHNIELLIENKIDITIGIVVHKQNLPNISDMINYFYPDIKSYHLMNVMPCKRVIDNADFLVVSRKELDSFYRQLHLEVKNKYPGIILNSPFSEFDCIEAEESIECERCFAGYTRIAITPDLKVLPCPISRNVIMGDLNCNNLTDIWKSDV
ncbi:MAG: radical SAM protein, partial [Nanoarchaeota archaeon]|nr:radical SAM protein [Nanoarchaeota archaeon]